MEAAPTHTIPVYLFELQNDEGALHGGGSDLHDVPGRHNAGDLRQFSGGGNKSFKESGKTRGTTLACGDTSDRYGWYDSPTEQ